MRDDVLVIILSDELIKSIRLNSAQIGTRRGRRASANDANAAIIPM